MRQFAVFLILACGIGPVWAQQDWKPMEKDIGAFEAVVQLPNWGKSTQYPNGHVPTPSEFVRYYAGSISNGHHILLAEFVGLDGGNEPGTHIVASPHAFPLISDGGCHILHIRYDLDAQRVESLQCNGLA
jgi:hypothetical protein